MRRVPSQAQPPHLEGSPSKCARRSAAKPGESTSIPLKLASSCSAISALLRLLSEAWLARGGTGGSEAWLMVPQVSACTAAAAQVPLPSTRVLNPLGRLGLLWRPTSVLPTIARP